MYAACVQHVCLYRVEQLVDQYFPCLRELLRERQRERGRDGDERRRAGRRGGKELRKRKS